MGLINHHNLIVVHWFSIYGILLTTGLCFAMRNEDTAFYEAVKDAVLTLDTIGIRSMINDRVGESY